MNFLISLFQLISITFVFTTANLFAQQNDRQLLPLNDEDYNCFQTIECVTNSESLKEKGWAIVFDDSIEIFSQEVTATMKVNNIALSAIYNKDGELIRATYKRQNIALPVALLSHLAEDLKGWIMTGNEMAVRDFDQNRTNYTVVMQNGNSKKTLRFSMSDVLEFENNNGAFAGK